MGKEVALENTSYDKYGRLLSRVKIGKVDIADSLISQRMAVPYDGGTKKSPSDWAEYFNDGSS
jgi:endonuclease YncB( thermonuclease family)